jgi:hypothetical protein
MTPRARTGSPFYTVTARGAVRPQFFAMTSGSSYLALNPSRNAWVAPQTAVAARTQNGFTLYRPVSSIAMTDDLTARANALIKVASIK